MLNYEWISIWKSSPGSWSKFLRYLIDWNEYKWLKIGIAFFSFSVQDNLYFRQLQWHSMSMWIRCDSMIESGATWKTVQCPRRRSWGEQALQQNLLWRTNQYFNCFLTMLCQCEKAWNVVALANTVRKRILNWNWDFGRIKLFLPWLTWRWPWRRYALNILLNQNKWIFNEFLVNLTPWCLHYDKSSLSYSMTWHRTCDILTNIVQFSDPRMWHKTMTTS